MSVTCSVNLVSQSVCQSVCLSVWKAADLDRHRRPPDFAGPRVIRLDQAISAALKLSAGTLLTHVIIAELPVARLLIRTKLVWNHREP